MDEPNPVNTGDSNATVFNIFLLENGLTDQKYSYLFKLVLPPSESYMSTSIYLLCFTVIRWNIILKSLKV